MKTLVYGRTKLYFLVGLFGLIIAYAGSSFAGKMISVSVGVDKQTMKYTHVKDIGFSVDKKSKGSIGHKTTKKGPAGAKYFFGFKGSKGKVSCGSAVLMRDSIVVLNYDGKICTNTIYAKKKKK